MKVACIFLTLNRVDLTLQCIKQNFFNAEVDADVFLIDNGSDAKNFNKIHSAYPFTHSVHFNSNRGISTAINQGIKLAEGYDGIVTLANDILMPRGWLRSMIHHAGSIPQSGMIGIHCVEKLPPLSERGVHECQTPYGNVMVTRKALDTVGYFNEEFDPYGQQDSDYGYRSTKMGFVNYYVPELKSEHIGHDVGQQTAYRKMKDEGLHNGHYITQKVREEYERMNNYVIRYED